MLRATWPLGNPCWSIFCLIVLLLSSKISGNSKWINPFESNTRSTWLKITQCQRFSAHDESLRSVGCWDEEFWTAFSPLVGFISKAPWTKCKVKSSGTMKKTCLCLACTLGHNLILAATQWSLNYIIGPCLPGRECSSLSWRDCTRGRFIFNLLGVEGRRSSRGRKKN